MRGSYTLEWLDSLVTVSLNPEKSNIASMSDAQISAIIDRVGKEKEKQQAILKQHIFGSTKEKQIELLLKQYHSSLVILLDQALENHRYVPHQKPGLKKLTNELIQCLDELLSFIEVRYSRYLSMEERVPVTYLKTIKLELNGRLERIKCKLIKSHYNDLGKIVLENLIFSSYQSKEFPITFQVVIYKKDLLNELERLKTDENDAYEETDLNALLIYMNFNSKAYVNYISQRIKASINQCVTLSDKLDKLFFHRKEFNQMRRKPGVVLNTHLADLKTEVNNWFEQEINYLKSKMAFSLVQDLGVKYGSLSINGQSSKSPKQVHKLLCALSVDQLALILKAADDSRIIISKSLNLIFKRIVPFLSTGHQEDISYDSMRSKSYVAEERDKDIAIQALEKMIGKIREY